MSTKLAPGAVADAKYSDDVSVESDSDAASSVADDDARSAADDDDDEDDDGRSAADDDEGGLGRAADDDDPYDYRTDARFGGPDDDEDDGDIDYVDDLQKIDADMKKNLILARHPELAQHSYEEIATLVTVRRDAAGVIADPLHRTVPFVTKYERARVLGERAKQLDEGADPFVEVPPNVIDSYMIALREFAEKKIPFIVKRPLPGGDVEYWKLEDLEI
jgi:DNA-directed RNA polymerase I, II, and III subunit RPABC2